MTSSTDTAAQRDDTMWGGLLHLWTPGTFMRFPHVPADRKALREAKANVAVLGFPWDATSIFRSGTNMGPKAIRDVSSYFTPFNSELGIDLRDVFRMVDCGDVDIVPANAESTMQRAAAALLEIMEADALPVMLGGDHSISIAGAWAITKKYKDTGLILFDMHYDTAADVVGEKLNHCCPIRRAVEAGINPKKICMIGPSGWMNPKTELAYVRDLGIRSISVDEVWRRGAGAVMDEAVKVAGAGGAAIYLTFDIDCMDSAFAPGTCVPTTFGLTPREILPMIRRLAGANVKLVDIVEVAPNLDHTSRTAHYAMRVLLEILAALSGRLTSAHAL